MITVIIAGGSGTRLWPLSTPNYPKHLLKVHGEQSLLQDTFARAQRLSGEAIYVVTDGSHAAHVKKQLPELAKNALIIEPGRRNTASCVVAALYHIQLRHDHDESIAFMWADHIVRDEEGFEFSFKKAAMVSQETGCQVLIGVEPTYPSTGFGYIKKGTRVDDDGLVYNVVTFKEKPEYDMAQRFVQSGKYLWNTGYFVSSLAIFLRVMHESAPELKRQYNDLLATQTRDEYERVYLNFIDEPIDTVLNEKIKDLLVIPASFDWRDIGSFNDLHDVIEKDEKGNFCRGKTVVLESENSYIHNETDVPLAVIGLDNVAVVSTADGVVVVRKDLAQKVKDAAKQSEEIR